MRQARFKVLTFIYCSWDLIVPSKDASKVIEHNEREGKS